MFPKVSLSILLGQVITCTADIDGALVRASALKFRQNVPYGRPIKVVFEDPNPQAQICGLIFISHDDGRYVIDEIPPLSDISAWQYTCGGQGGSDRVCDPTVYSGTLTFSAKDPYSIWIDFHMIQESTGTCIFVVVRENNGDDQGALFFFERTIISLFSLHKGCVTSRVSHSTSHRLTL